MGRGMVAAFVMCPTLQLDLLMGNQCNFLFMIFSTCWNLSRGTQTSDCAYRIQLCAGVWYVLLVLLLSLLLDRRGQSWIHRACPTLTVGTSRTAVRSGLRALRNLLYKINDSKRIVYLKTHTHTHEDKYTQTNYCSCNVIMWCTIMFILTWSSSDGNLAPTKCELKEPEKQQQVSKLSSYLCGNLFDFDRASLHGSLYILVLYTCSVPVEES